MNKPRAKKSGALHLLGVRQVQAAEPGDRADGGGLVLRVGTDERATWVFRYTAADGRRREMGMGTCHRASAAQAGDSLTAARDAAHKARELLRQGIDPIDANKAARQAAREALEARKEGERRERWTLARCARDYHARLIEPSRTARHAAQWIASLENHIPAALWNAPIDSIKAPELLTALLAIKPHERARNVTDDDQPHETVKRIRQRLEAVFESEQFNERCTGNPAAAIKRMLAASKPKKKGRREGFRHLPYKEAPAFMQAVRQAQGVAARALELVTLTASRTSEVLNAEWSEFDLDAAVWVCPAARMKAGEPHTVHLSPQALAVVRSMQGLHPRWVFPSPAAIDQASAKPMSNMAMLEVLNRIGWRDRTTVHGLRKVFSTWANDTAAARPDVIEACLAHEETNRVRAAYNKATFDAERRALLAAWAAYLDRPPAAVLELPGRAEDGAVADTAVACAA